MKWSDFVKEVAKSHDGITQKAVNDVWNSMVDTMLNLGGQEIEIPLKGFGKLKVIHKKAHMQRNPLTGKKVKVPSKYVPRFKLFPSFRKSINNGRYEVESL